VRAVSTPSPEFAPVTRAVSPLSLCPRRAPTAVVSLPEGGGAATSTDRAGHRAAVAGLAAITRSPSRRPESG
jgi:hypothetical protein